MSTCPPSQNKRYTSDVTDAEWALIEPHLPPPRSGNGRPGRPRVVDLREVWNAVAYIAKTQCQWANLPKDFPPKSTVFEHFTRWQVSGALQRINGLLSREARKRAGREETPSRAIIDAQSIKCTTSRRGGGEKEGV